MNKKSNLFGIMAALTMLGLAVLACGPTPAVVTPAATQVVPAATQATSGQTPGKNTTASRSDMIAATVEIYGVSLQGGNITPIYVGSGSIISANGLILTNAHVAQPSAVGDPEGDPDALVIGIVQSEDQPPVYSYRAQVKAVDGYMDLAVIQITSTLKGDSVDPSGLHLPYVSLGNSDQIHVGDHLNIFGFPYIGGDTITYTSGNVSGFTSEDQLGDRAWIKTDATISGGNSGGMAADDQGQLIGVPSIASSGADRGSADCRVIQDTNGDGVINSQDSCIPIGGFINGIRPINLAMPLIRAAEGGQAYASPYASQGEHNGGGSIATGNEQIGQITWFAVDSQGNLGNPVTSYPSGTNIIVAGFPFSGFTNGETWGEQWTANGTTIYTGDYPWDQGASGEYATYINASEGSALPDATYHVELYAGNGNAPLSQSDVVIGNGSNTNVPGGRADIQISGTITDKASGNPVSGAYLIVLNSGTSYADWTADNYSESDVLTYVKTDSSGRYSLPDKLWRNTPYTVIASAEGYYDAYGDDMVWSDSDPANYVLNVSLTK